MDTNVFQKVLSLPSMSSCNQLSQTKCRLRIICACDLEAAGLTDSGAGVSAPVYGGHITVVGGQVGADTDTLAGAEQGEEGVQLQQVDPAVSMDVCINDE